jgi:glycosyltransferase involved in cell wall biosynthesis
MRYRVLHVIDSFDLGGAQEALLNVVALADRERFDIDVATMHGRGVYWDRFEHAGARVCSLSPSKFVPVFVFRLMRLIARRRYHVVHCHLTASNLIAKPIAALLGVPVRFNHDQNNDEARRERKLLLWLDKIANRLSTHICAVSASTRDVLLSLEGVPTDRVSVVYNAIDLKRFAPAPHKREAARKRWELPAEGRIIAGIGRLTYQKNFELFLDAAADVLRDRPDAFFVIAGTGPDEAALKQKAATLHIGERVRFLGYVSATEELYPAIDFLMMPSRYEGLPMALLEAMSMRVPVIASRVDGIAEIIEDGVHGALATPGSRSDFVEKTLDLLAHPDKAAQFADAARAKVVANFSAEKMTREVEALYLRYLEPRP